MGCISSKDEERENHGFDQVYREKQQVDTPPLSVAYTGIFKVSDRQCMVVELNIKCFYDFYFLTSRRSKS